MNTYLLGIDVGTSACKVALFRTSGQVAAQEMCVYPVFYPKAGWAEQNPEDWWVGVCTSLRAVLRQSGIDPADISAIGVDGQSWSAVAVDAAGSVLCNTPIWTDTRARDECEQIRARIPDAALFAVCGNPIQPSYTLPKILWYQNHMPDVYRQAEYILQSNSFIVMRLTGEVTQDRSQGYGLCCYDMKHGRWDMAVAKELGVRPELLPPLFDCHQVVGRVTDAADKLTGLAAGTPVVAGGLDAACGTLGAGVCSAGEAQEQGGQAGGMSLCIDHYAADPRLILAAVILGTGFLQDYTVGRGAEMAARANLPRAEFTQMSDFGRYRACGRTGFLPYMAGEAAHRTGCLRCILWPELCKNARAHDPCCDGGCWVCPPA